MIKLSFLGDNIQMYFQNNLNGSKNAKVCSNQTSVLC